MDVAGQRDEVCVVETENGFIPSLEQMPLAVMSKVEGHRICREQTLHDPGQRGAPYSYCKAKMITHQAVGKNREGSFILDDASRLQE